MTDTDVLEKVEITISLGDNFKVIFHNDDKTSMEFVILVLISIFNVHQSKAIQLMFDIHNNGSAVVAEYSCYDIAEEKAKQTMTAAREYGYPLKVTVEK